MWGPGIPSAPWMRWSQISADILAAAQQQQGRLTLTPEQLAVIAQALGGCVSEQSAPLPTPVAGLPPVVLEAVGSAAAGPPSAPVAPQEHCLAGSDEEGLGEDELEMELDLQSINAEMGLVVGVQSRPARSRSQFRRGGASRMASPASSRKMEQASGSLAPERERSARKALGFTPPTSEPGINT